MFFLYWFIWSLVKEVDSKNLTGYRQSIMSLSDGGKLYRGELETVLCRDPIVWNLFFSYHYFLCLSRPTPPKPHPILAAWHHIPGACAGQPLFPPFPSRPPFPENYNRMNEKCTVSSNISQPLRFAMWLLNPSLYMSKYFRHVLFTFPSSPHVNDHSPAIHAVPDFSWPEAQTLYSTKMTFLPLALLIIPILRSINFALEMIYSQRKMQPAMFELIKFIICD